MKDILTILRNRYDDSKSSILALIVDDKGSAPRGAGAAMVVGKKGLISGTIGGGNLEYQSTKIAQQLLIEGESKLEHFCLSPNQVADLGMICGGDVDVLFLYIPMADDSIGTLLNDAFEAMKSRRAAWLIMPLDCSGLGLYTAEKGIYGVDIPGEISEKLAACRQGVLELCGKECYVQQLLECGIIYLFGGGHLTKELVPVLAHMDFRCIVADDRVEFCRPERFPEAEAVQIVDYAKLEGVFNIRAEDYICIMTRGHLGDYDCESYALSTPAGYIGVVGSSRKIATINEKLLAEGFTKEDIERVTTPIGLDIMSETPPEIAISIAAQLVLHRAKRREEWL
ncbi:MAG: XdhC family protein [Oscillospiraceae bacterium]|nr:XdhC family protein [Oscillospiraceae bacterium]